jgi:two-component sensor histidine kinase
VAALLRFALTPLVGETGVPFLTFFPVVLIAALIAGPVAGITTLILSSLIAGFFWLDPPRSFTIAHEAVLRLSVFYILCALLITIAALLRALVRALAQSEERALVLAHEMTHRARNVLGLAHAISRQTFQGAGTLAEYQTLFESRLLALSRAQELITQSPAIPTDLKTLLDRALEPFDVARFNMSGTTIGVPLELGSTLTLLFHELATNSLKYGALSVPQGRVVVNWNPRGQDVHLDWCECDGPTVAPPSRTGFGSRLLRTAFPPGRGQAAISYAPSGVECKIVFPAAA